MFAMQVDEGDFGGTSMRGVKFAAQYHGPGPMHEGNGTVQSILDERSSSAQREAVLQILSGRAGNPSFEVVASRVSRVLEPEDRPDRVRARSPEAAGPRRRSRSPRDHNGADSEPGNGRRARHRRRPASGRRV
ncbi:MAG: hypothetical protein DME09_09850 [Candidatus Rokuibacteriota bacterium]|nr:MAG: hypothetical protein DME09_09850 [Candidatus Rokubacteria bacterium]